MSTSRPLTTPASVVSASSAKDTTSSDATEAGASVARLGEVPTDKINIMRIVHMMHGGTMASLGLACCCCCGGGQAEPIELKYCTIGAKRGPYVTGKRLLEWCQAQAFRLPFAPTEENVIKLAEGMLEFEVLLKAKKDPDRARTIHPVRDPKEKVASKDPLEFNKDWYVWHYEGNPMVRNALMTLIVCVVIFFCLMPAWPRSMKVGVWYCSCTMLLIMFGFLILRNTLWLIVWICSGWNLTIFPYVLIDGIPISMVFQPWGGPIKAWGNLGSWYQDDDPSMRYYRVGTLVSCIALGFWVWNQPTEFDDYMLASKAFTDDLYSGNLLSDMSNTDKKNIDKPKYQSLADILFEEAEVAADADAASAEASAEPAKKKVPSLDDLENMDLEDEEASAALDPEAAEAAALLAEILEDEAEETGTH